MALDYAILAAQSLDQQTRIKKAIDALRARQAAYTLPDRYYRGDHRLAFATDKFRNAFGTLFKEFADNLSRPVVDAVVDRLEVTGFENELADDADNASLDDAWRIWQDNRMDLGAIEVHLDAVLYGDGYVIVWPDDDGAPEIHPNDPWSVTVRYDTERRDRILWAAKWWKTDDDFCRLTLYYPDRIEKYVTTKAYPDEYPTEATAFVQYATPAEPWPLPNPYDRVPVFHFVNGAKRGRMGTSDLADVIPIQDALNKQVADLLIAGEYISFPQRYAIGIELDTDPDTGKKIQPFTSGPGNLWVSEADKASFGQFDPADMSQFVGTLDNWRTEIARVSRTPLHYLVPMTGTPPSGESLRVAEGPFIEKCKRKQLVFGNTWEDVMEFALAIAGQSTEGVRLSALWRDPETRSEKDDLEGMDIKRNKIGISKRQALRELGYSEAQIEKMEAEADEAAAEMATAMAATAPPPQAGPPAQGGGGQFGRSS